MMKCYLATLFLAGAVQLATSHSYHIGDCPQVTPLRNFTMEKFLGKWYVIQKTKSSNKNQILHYSRGDSDDEYRVVEDAVRPIIGRTEYTGKLKPTDKPGLMTVKFQLNPGSYDYIIFMTDYDNYAGVFSCQSVLGANRRAASILSRKPTLDDKYLKEVRDTLDFYDVEIKDLSDIKQNTDDGSDRSTSEDDVPLDIDPRFGPEGRPNSHNSSDLHLFKK